MTHVVRGLDRKGNLLVDIVISGDVPDLPSSNLTLHPFTEDYIQTGPGSIYALSTRTYKIGDYILPYSWNHSIFYDDSLGEMPFVVERLYADNIESQYDPDTLNMKFFISAAIGIGPTSDDCFEGFKLSSNGVYCEDINECENNSCSHICNNFPGGFSCQCFNGFELDVDEVSCIDLNECDINIDDCSTSEECINTLGSYKCIIICKEGYRRSENEQYCTDINECIENS
ncbi:hemicentin-1, partial [Parasteatoda tepidariorum]|uniref:hemicentin-1 n=1 Tax=Parasteatoda tepidariorum TaxID=114398 RepID=UPI0039BD6834